MTTIKRAPAPKAAAVPKAKSNVVQTTVRDAADSVKSAVTGWVPGGTAKGIDAAKASKNPVKLAEALHGLAKDRLGNDQTRIDQTKTLLGGMNAKQIDAVRAAYVE